MLWPGCRSLNCDIGATIVHPAGSAGAHLSPASDYRPNNLQLSFTVLNQWYKLKDLIVHASPDFAVLGVWQKSVAQRTTFCINPLIATLKPQNNGPLCSNMVIGALAVDGLLHLVQAIQRGGARAGCGPAQSTPRCTKCNSPPTNGQCTNLYYSMWHYNCLCARRRRRFWHATLGLRSASAFAL